VIHISLRQRKLWAKKFFKAATDFTDFTDFFNHEENLPQKCTKSTKDFTAENAVTTED
jgi:hypothetical protein